MKAFLTLLVCSAAMAIFGTVILTKGVDLQVMGIATTGLCVCVIAAFVAVCNLPVEKSED